MKITPSPLVSSFSGTAGSAVASTWKGINYIREHVIPANPRTVAQQAQRAAMAEAVAIWQPMNGVLQGGYNLGAAPLQISGFNDWTKRNVVPIKDEAGMFGPRRDLKAEGDYIEIPTDFIFADESASDEQHFTWTDPGQGADYHFGRIVYDATDNVVLDATNDVGLLSLGEDTITGIITGHVILVGYWVYRVTDTQFVHFGSTAHTQS